MVPSRVEADAPGLLFAPLDAAPAVAALIPDDEFETPPLPREHPKWIKDGMVVSQRAKQLLERVKPIPLRVLRFWDHAVRSLTILDRRISIDSSGSYRMEV
jgi:hypothetical protein